MIKAHTWHNTGDGLPMGWVNCDLPPYEAATRVIEFLSAPNSSRVLFVWHWPDTDPFGDMAYVVRKGPKTLISFLWFTEFWRLVKASGCPKPARIVIDYEGGCGCDQFGDSIGERIAPIYADPAVRKCLPKAARWIEPAKLAEWWKHEDGAAMVRAWNEYALPLCAKMLKGMAVDTAASVGWTGIKSTNYFTSHPSFPCYDSGANLLFSSGCMTAESSPGLYLERHNFCRYQGAKYGWTEADWLWLQFLVDLNTARSNRNMGTVLPWLAWPSYSGGSPWLWREFVRHLGQLGIRDVLGWWPSDQPIPESDHVVMRQTMTETLVRAMLSTDVWMPIDYRSRSVTTGNVTTTYDEFAKVDPTPTDAGNGR